MTNVKQNIQSIENIPGIRVLGDHGAQAVAGGAFEVDVSRTSMGYETEGFGFAPGLGLFNDSGTVRLEDLNRMSLRNLNGTSFGNPGEEVPGNYFSIDFVKRNGKSVGTKVFGNFSTLSKDELDKYRDKGAVFADITQQNGPDKSNK